VEPSALNPVINRPCSDLLIDFNSMKGVPKWNRHKKRKQNQLKEKNKAIKEEQKINQY
jgi:hypothetical protein